MAKRHYRPVAARPDGDGLGVRVTVAFDVYLKVKPNNDSQGRIRYDRLTFEDDFIKVVAGVIGEGPPIPEPTDLAIITVPANSEYLTSDRIRWVKKL